MLLAAIKYIHLPYKNIGAYSHHNIKALFQLY